MPNAKMVHRHQTKHQWLSGLAIILTSLICLFGFWRLSPGVTFIVAATALIALVVLFWIAGKEN